MPRWTGLQVPQPYPNWNSCALPGFMYWAFYKIPVDKKVLNLKIIISDQHTEAQDIGTANRTPPPQHPTPPTALQKQVILILGPRKSDLISWVMTGSYDQRAPCEKNHQSRKTFFLLHFLPKAQDVESSVLPPTSPFELPL